MGHGHRHSSCCVKSELAHPACVLACRCLNIQQRQSLDSEGAFLIVLRAEQRLTGEGKLVGLSYLALSCSVISSQSRVREMTFKCRMFSLVVFPLFFSPLFAFLLLITSVILHPNSHIINPNPNCYAHILNSFSIFYLQVSLKFR